MSCSVQTPPLRTKTYAEPEFEPLSSSKPAPTKAVSPLTLTE